MKKVGLIIVLILTICLALTACNHNGDEKEQKTIEIKTVEDLKGIKDCLGDKYSLYTFELKNDIDLSNENWEPIGYNNENSFRATFNGNGYTISSLSIKGAENSTYLKKIPYSYIGLFGYIYNATIQNLKLVDFDINFFAENDYTHIGGLAGYAYGNNTISQINIDGNIEIGTSFYLRKKSVLMEFTCDQMQYIGGLIGFSSGKLVLTDSISNVGINNLIGSRGPQYDLWEEDFIYEKNEKDENTTTIAMEVKTDIDEPAYFPSQAFAGGFIGLAKGKGTELRNLQATAQIPIICSESAYLGGLFGSAYQAEISEISFTGNLGTKVSIKGVMGGIAGLIDETTIINAEVLNTELMLSVSKSEYQAYTAGGIAGYANDFSTIQNSAIVDTKIMSNLINKESIDNIRNYPVIGGIAGTIRDSSVYDCEVQNGGVYRLKTLKGDSTYQYTAIDDRFIYSAGMVADVYGNSNVVRCTSSFLAYKGAIAKASESVYVEENGRRVLRFIKKDMPKVYIDVDAFVEGEVLVLNFIDDAGDIIGTKEYTSFEGTNIEEYSHNYYDEITGRLNDKNGIVVVINDTTFDGYERLTGMYSFSELDYLKATVICVDENDEDINAEWKRMA